MIHIKQNKSTNETELYIGIGYQASWKAFPVPDESICQLEQMLTMAFEAGKITRSKEIRELLGAK